MLTRTPIHRHRCRSVTTIIVLVAALGLTACSSDTTTAGSPTLVPDATTATPVIDPATGEPVALPDEFDFSFAGDDDQDATETTDTGSDSDSGSDGDGDTGSDENAPTPPPAETDASTPTPHPLESVVIDTVVVDEENPPVLDEAGALACANTEFALDAIIEGSDDLDDLLDTAADWAAQSTVDLLAARADDLADRGDAAATEDLVVAVLGDCAASGYEL